jgi:hypothetical protein
MNPHKMNELCADLEWDTFAATTDSVRVEKLGDLTENLGTVSVTRDAECQLSADITVDADSGPLRQEMQRYRRGETPEGILLVAGDDLERLELDRVLVSSFTTSVRDDSTVTRAHLHLGQATRRFGSPNPPSVLAEWYLSGPEPNTYARLTRREYQVAFSRRRSGLSEDTDDAEPIVKPPRGSPPDSGFSRDYFLLTPANGVRAILSSVPRDHGPTWSRNVSIEYRHDGLPSDNTRKNLVEGIGVFFGRHVLPIGTTTFDIHGYPITSVGWSPWGRDAQAMSRTPDEPLFRCDYRSIESNLNDFLTKYLSICDEFDLSSVAWTIWIARRTAIGPDLALYAMALERLMNGWFRNSRSKSKGTYMPKEQFEALLGEELAQAGSKLTETAYGDRILRRLSSSFQMGVNERFRAFFEEIGLRYSEGELQVIKSRNRPAHGGNIRNPAEALLLSRAYRVLLTRAMLTVLGHEGTYTDYSVLGFPEKPLREPIGGMAG